MCKMAHKSIYRVVDLWCGLEPMLLIWLIAGPDDPGEYLNLLPTPSHNHISHPLIYATRDFPRLEKCMQKTSSGPLKANEWLYL